MNLRNILHAHRDAVSVQEQAAQQMEEACQEIDRVINNMVRPSFEEAERQIGEVGFDVSMEVESRMLESHRHHFRFTAACTLTAGKSIPASILSFDGSPRNKSVDYTKVVGGLKHKDSFSAVVITEEMVTKELEIFVQEAFPSSSR